MQKPQTNDSMTHNVEVFCHMLLEEFLTTRNMHTTLRAFRKEWERPTEDVTVFSWYNLIMKLQMSELLDDTEKGSTKTVLESIVKTLAKESSIRTRRPIEVTINGMASMPKVKTLPYLSDPLSVPPSFESKPPLSPTKDKKTESSAMNKTVKSSVTRKKFRRSSESSLIPSKLERLDKFVIGKLHKTSTENWLPESFRLKSRMRDIALAQETLDSMIVREIDFARENKRISTPIYDRALNEESLTMVKKHPCGCCLQKYLYVNLPLKVSQKAIIDIRVKWTGNMTSATIFNGTRTMTAAASYDAGIDPNMMEIIKSSRPNTITMSNTLTSSALNTMTNTNTNTKTFKNKKLFSTTIDGKSNDAVEYHDMHVSRSSINVYDQVLVCLFCKQFFQNQEDYRPSYAEMVHSERKTAHLKELEKEKLYWDPLMMIDKDKKEEEDEKERKNEYEAYLLKSQSFHIMGAANDLNEIIGDDT